MTKIIHFFILWLLIQNINLSQQFADVAEIRYNLSPGNSFKDTSIQSSVSDFYTMVNLPLMRKDFDVIIAGLSYEYFSASNFTSGKNLELHAVQAKIGWIHTWNQHNSSMLFFFPELSSDVVTDFVTDTKLAGAIIHTFKRDDSRKIKLGIYYKHDYSGPYLLPLVGLYRNFQQVFELNMLLPSDLSFYYIMKNKYQPGILYRAITNSFLYEKDYYLQQTVPVLYFSNNIIVSKGWHLQVNAGYSFLRAYSLYSLYDKVNLQISSIEFPSDRKVLNPEMNNGGVLEFRLLYRFELKQE